MLREISPDSTTTSYTHPPHDALAAPHAKALKGRSSDEPRERSHHQQKQVLFVNRSYWPDMEATGQLLTELSEGLSKTQDFEVSVLCGAPNFPAPGAQYKKRGTEVVNGVEIRRTWHTTFDKSNFFGRLFNFITFCVSAFFALLFGPKPDLIVCQTDPPLSPIAACLVAFLRRVKFVCYLQDVYPDIAVQCGKVREGFFIKVLRKFLVWCYCRAEKIVVVSNDMRDWLRDHGVDDSKVEVIQNWVDTKKLTPIKENNAFRDQHFLDGKFVIMYSGNIGQTQRFELLLGAAQRLKGKEDIVFMIVGGGVRAEQVKSEVQQRDLPNVRFLPYQSKEYLSQSLSAADIQVVMLDQSMTKLMMPSKLYSALAAGTCILGLGDPDSHLAEIVIDNGCGWFFGENQLDELVEQIELASQDAQLVESVGQASRDFAIANCDRQTAIDNYHLSLSAMLGVKARRPVEADLELAQPQVGEVELATSRSV